ncbi:hypothetical protein [Congregicoccus parvus]|uniref:hypothetical protein n=1 Tax=Congregicoccus parvus TaxID=3081749 RepID=UPI003FA53736
MKAPFGRLADLAGCGDALQQFGLARTKREVASGIDTDSVFHQKRLGFGHHEQKTGANEMASNRKLQSTQPAKTRASDCAGRVNRTASA